MDEKLLARALGAAFGLGSTAAGKTAGDGVDEAVSAILTVQYLPPPDAENPFHQRAERVRSEISDPRRERKSR